MSDSFAADSFKPDSPPDSFAPDGAKQEAFKQPEGSAASRAAGGFLSNTIGGLSNTIGGLAHTAKTIVDAAGAYYSGRPMPPEVAQDLGNVVQAHYDQARKTKEAWGRGEHVEAFGHALATALPVVGPAAAHAGERIGGEAPELDKYGNVTKQGQAPDIAGGLGEGAGLIVSSSPKNVVNPVARAAGAVAAKIPVPARLTPEGMYQSALRPGLSKKNLPKIDSEVATGLREGIPVSSKGLETTRARIEDVNKEIADKVAAKSEELGPVISPKAVASRVKDVESTFKDQVNPKDDIAALDKSKAEFLNKHTTEAPYTKVRPGTDEAAGSMVPYGQGVTKTEKLLTLSEAQAEKQGTYRQLRKKYGELGSSSVETQKNLARGLKEEIVARYPELTELNARDSSLINLETEMERMVAREGNKNILGLVPATMTRNPYGFLATVMMDNPAIKSRIAIALDRARKITIPNTAPLAPAAIPGAVAGQQQDSTPRFAHGGIAGLRGPEEITVGDGGEPEAIIPLSHIRMLGPQAQRHLLRGIGAHLGVGKRKHSTLGSEIGGRDRYHQENP